MKIEAKDNQIILKEVFNGIIIETQEGKQLRICLRDYGFDVRLDDGKWHHITDEQDFGNVYCGRPTTISEPINEDGTPFVETIEFKIWKYYECIHGDKVLTLIDKTKWIKNWMNSETFNKYYPDVDFTFIMNVLKNHGK